MGIRRIAVGAGMVLLAALAVHVSVISHAHAASAHVPVLGGNSSVASDQVTGQVAVGTPDGGFGHASKMLVPLAALTVTGAALSAKRRS